MSNANTELKEAAIQLGANGFHVHPLAGKTPATKNGFYDATSNVEIIGDQWSGPYEGYNIGVRTGSASKIIVLDVDQKPGGANGMNSLLELQKRLGQLANTVMQKTGTGHHYIYRYDGDDIRCSIEKLGPGLDIKAEGGYIVVAPSIHPKTNTPYAFFEGHQLTLDALAPAPEPLLQLLRQSDRKVTDTNRHETHPASVPVPTDYGSSVLAAECRNVQKAPCGQQEPTLNKAAFAVGQLVRSSHIGYQEAMTALIDAGLAMSNCDPRHHWTKAEIEKKVKASLLDGMRVPRTSVPEASPDEELDSQITELNKSHAVVMMGGKCLVLTETKALDGRSITVNFSSFTDFKNQYCTKTVKVGKAYQKLGNAWLEHPNRRFYNQVVFDPSSRSNTAYNLWQGFAVQPVKGNCSLFLGHIRNVIAAGDEVVYEYLLNFMADAVQNITVRPGVALVLRGGPGTGKGFFVHAIGELFGKHFLRIDNPRNLLGNFNRELEDKLLVFADEAFWAGEKTAEGRFPLCQERCRPDRIWLN